MFRLIGCSLWIAGFALGQAPPDPHLAGIIPNYKTVSAKDPFVTMSARAKFKLAAQDSFDPFVLPVAAMYGGIAHVQNQNPSWGQGAKGYFHRYGASLLDSTDGNFMTEAIYPTLLHQDPRYFRLGEGNAGKRIGYALTRVLVTKTDSGRSMFNLSEVAGNFTMGAVSNLYYPPEARNIWATTRRGAQQTMWDAAFNILKEYWPDIHRKLKRK